MTAPIGRPEFLTPPDQPPRQVEHATCLACGCLCDDITLTIASNRIVAADAACERGCAWFLADHASPHQSAATIKGQPASLPDALAQATALLHQSRRLLITGLEAFPIETQRQAITLADRLGASIDPAHGPGQSARVQACQRLGATSATLGEVKNRADLVVFWAVDPVATHPRHLERYSVEPVGKFLPQGRASRTVLAAAPLPNATTPRADHFLQVSPAHETAVIHHLRSLVRGQQVSDELAARCGSTLADLQQWAGLLRASRYCAWFHEPADDPAREEEITRLIRDLNAHTRTIGLTLGAPGNPAGAEAALTWQAGYPMAVSFSRGFPRYLPDTATAQSILERAEADAALIVGEPRPLSQKARDHLARIPRVIITPRPDQVDPAATVSLACAVPGIHQGGTVLRCDGVALPLRPALADPRPTATAWLQTLLDALASQNGGN